MISFQDELLFQISIPNIHWVSSDQNVIALLPTSEFGTSKNYVTVNLPILYLRFKTLFMWKSEL